MLLVFCILLIVTVCVSIVATYFLLNAEDWGCFAFQLSLGSRWFFNKIVPHSFQMAVDVLSLRGLDGLLRVPLLRVLFLQQNQDVRVAAGTFHLASCSIAMRFFSTHFLQTSYYFGYMGLFCLMLFLLCGTACPVAPTVAVA